MADAGVDVAKGQGSSVEDGLWRAFALEHNGDIRQKIIDHYMPSARIIAATMYAKRPSPELEFGEYMQFAVVGLLESIERFDLNRNVNFMSYATHRIHGAIVAGVAKLSEKLEQGAYRKRMRQERIASLREGVEPTTRDAVFQEMVEVALGLALGYMLEDSGMFVNEDNRADDDPYSCYELKALQRRIAAVVESLPERERSIIRYHYYQHVSFKEISVILGVTAGRVSQIHARALALIREAVAGLGRLDVAY